VLKPFLGVKNWQKSCGFVGGRIIVQEEKNLESRTHLDEPLSESKELQSSGCSKILLSFFMRLDGHF
jgi:hypothetical protein